RTEGGGSATPFRSNDRADRRRVRHDLSRRGHAVGPPPRRIGDLRHRRSRDAPLAGGGGLRTMVAGACPGRCDARRPGGDLGKHRVVAGVIAPSSWRLDRRSGSMSLLAAARSLLEGAVDLVLAPICVGCGALIPTTASERLICGACWTRLREIP